MNVLIADSNSDSLDAAAADLEDVGAGALHTQLCDVSDVEQVCALQKTAAGRFGDVHCLMNNAGAGFAAGLPWENVDTWKRQLEVNLWGIIHGCQAFLPNMLESGTRAAVINTGSKQGITNPPGNYAYNLSKAGVKNYTESLAHALRQMDDCQVSAHLLIPGFTYTGMMARALPEKPPGAWTPEELIAFMVTSLERGDFYVLCPDNETPRALDEKRIQWSADDLIRNRSALSRWDPEYKEAYEAFIAG